MKFNYIEEYFLEEEYFVRSKELKNLSTLLFDRSTARFEVCFYFAMIRRKKVNSNFRSFSN